MLNQEEVDGIISLIQTLPLDVTQIFWTHAFLQTFNLSQIVGLIGSSPQFDLFLESFLAKATLQIDEQAEMKHILTFSIVGVSGGLPTKCKQFSDLVKFIELKNILVALINFSKNTDDYNTTEFSYISGNNIRIDKLVERATRLGYVDNGFVFVDDYDNSSSKITDYPLGYSSSDDSDKCTEHEELKVIPKMINLRSCHICNPVENLGLLDNVLNSSRSLKNLVLHISNNDNSMRTFATEMISRYSKKFKVCIIEEHGSNEKVTFERFKAAYSSLEMRRLLHHINELELEITPDCDFECLSKLTGLTKLVLDVPLTGCYTNFKSEFIKNLIINGSINNLIGDSDLSELTSLEELTLNNCLISEKFMETLPSTVNNLKLINCTEKTFPQILNAPSYLRTLEIVSSSDFIEFPTFKNLHKTILTEVIIKIDNTLVKKRRKVGRFVPSSFLRTLPVRLLKLSIQIENSSDDEPAPIWKAMDLRRLHHLKELNLTNESNNPEEFDLSLLPENLETLLMKIDVSGFKGEFPYGLKNLSLRLEHNKESPTQFNAIEFNKRLQYCDLYSLSIEGSSAEWCLENFDFKRLAFLTVRYANDSGVIQMNLPELAESFVNFQFVNVNEQGAIGTSLSLKLIVPSLTKKIRKCGLLSCFRMQKTNVIERPTF